MLPTGELEIAERTSRINDRIGNKLCDWRVCAVLPTVRGRLLDIGCGNNKLVRAYTAAGGQGLGVDVYPWEGSNLLVKDTADLPYADGDFDIVTIIAALNHIPNRRQVLNEAHRVLKADGRVVLTMLSPVVSPVWHTLRRPWDADQHERGMKEGEVYGLSHRQVYDLLFKAGFEVTRESRFMLGLNRLTVAMKVDGEGTAHHPESAHAAPA